MRREGHQQDLRAWRRSAPTRPAMNPAQYTQRWLSSRTKLLFSETKTRNVVAVLRTVTTKGQWWPGRTVSLGASVARRRRVHRVVDVALAGRCLRCPPVAQTPIYDQLCGERLHAEVSAGGDNPQRLDHPGRHRLADDLAVPAAVFGSPEADSCWASQPVPATDRPGYGRDALTAEVVNRGV